MHIATPNLQILLHYYNCADHLFRTITMLADEERERVFDEVVAAKNWHWGRFAPENRQSYMATRRFVEARMHDEFSHKYGTPRQPHPVFFYLFSDLSLPAIEERLRQRRHHDDELNTKYLLMDLRDLADTTQISFTLGDSHRSYRELLIRQGLSDAEPGAPRADYGEVFHIRELAEVYERNKAEEGLNFEVQVWDPEILERWRAGHDIP